MSTILLGMGFAGNLRTLSLAEVLQTLNRIKATGILRLASTDGGRDVVFNDGELIGLSFRDSGDHKGLLGLLVAQGKVSAEDAQSLTGKGSDPVAVIDALLQRGLIALDDAHEVMKQQSLDELYNLGTWPHGDFVFLEATAEEKEIQDTVETFRKHPLSININSLLLESAKRLDDWQRIRQYFSDEEQVLAAVEKNTEVIQKAAAAYPGCSVVPMVDGIQSVDEIVRNSTASRYEVYSVLLDLLNLGAIRPLERGDFLEHGEFRYGREDYVKAAQLFRKALLRDPNDQDTAAKLDQCLVRANGFPGEPECYGTLAQSYLASSAAERAIECAQKAVKLSPLDPDLRLNLVRCYIEAEAKEEAISELREVTKHFLEINRLEDARNTCLKILEIDKNNLEAHRELSRIFSQAAMDPASEDVVICVQCGEVNHRENANCNACRSQLQLTCTSCNRIVAASDRLCIFCGANPHAGTEKHERVPAGSPGTSRIVDTAKIRKAVQEKGSKVWRAELEKLLKEARAFEQSNDLEQAIVSWKEVAKIQVESPELMAHIRQLESQLHEQFIESAIERGHELRRSRHYYRATKAYRKALSALSSEDPRYARLKEILKSAQYNHLRISLIYGVSFVVIAAIAALVLMPYWKLSGMRGEIAEHMQVVRSAKPSVEDMGKAYKAIADLDKRAKALGSGSAGKKARGAVDEFRGDFVLAAGKAGAQEVEAIKKLMDGLNVDQATSRLSSFSQAFGDDIMPTQVKQLKELLVAAEKRKKDTDKQRAEAPQQLTTAQECEAKDELAKALDLYQQLADGANQEIATQAAAERDRLAAVRKLYDDAWNAAGEKMAISLDAAAKSIEALADDSRRWNNVDAFARRRDEVKARQAAAIEGFKKIKSSRDPSVFEEFSQTHPATPQAIEARTLAQQLKSSNRMRDEAVASFKAAMDGKAYEQAWKLGRALYTNFATEMKAGEILLPLHLTSQPDGVSVSIDGQGKGKTPLDITYDPNNTKATATFSFPGYRSVSMPMSDLMGDWQRHTVLQRQSLWSKKHGDAPSGANLQLSSGSIAVNIGDELCLIKPTGELVWKKPASSGNELVDATRATLRYPPIEVGSRQLAFAMADKNVVLVDEEKGTTVRTYPTKLQPGRPVAYVNEMFGQGRRLAFAAEFIYFGDLGADPSRIKLADAAISGPIAMSSRNEQLLIVATRRGHLVAFNEITQKEDWDVDMRASEVGLMILDDADKNALVTILDGSRLVCYHVTADNAEMRWTEELGAAAVGDVVISDGVAYIACGKSIVARALDGTRKPPIALPGNATCALAVRGDCMAIGCDNNELIVFKNRQPAWSTPVPARISSICLGDDLVVAGQSDGTFTAFKP